MNQAFLVIQYMMLCLALGLFSIALFTMVYSPRDYLDVRLEGNRASMLLVRSLLNYIFLSLLFLLPPPPPPPSLSLPLTHPPTHPPTPQVPVIMTGYLLTLLAKEIVAVDTIEVLQQSQLGYMFMFKKADMDIISMTMMVTCGAVLVGSFHECRNKFRLAAFMAFLHVLISFPVMAGTFAAYDQLTYPYKGMRYRLWELESCKSYINSKNLVGTPFLPPPPPPPPLPRAFLSPSSHSFLTHQPIQGIFTNYPSELTEICREVQLSLIGRWVGG